MKDDLQAIKYENVAFQAQRDVYQAQLQGCPDTITHLRTRYLDYARVPGKDSVIIIVRKHTASVNDKFHDLPYYITKMQWRKRYIKLRWLDRYFPDHEVIVKTVVTTQTVFTRLIDLKGKDMLSKNATTLG